MSRRTAVKGIKKRWILNNLTYIALVVALGVVETVAIFMMVFTIIALGKVA